MLTMQQFIEANHLAMDSRPIDRNPNMDDMPKGSAHFACTITGHKWNQITIPYSVGPGFTEGKPDYQPELSGVLQCLADDAAGFINAESFEDWAPEYGYDPYSRKAECIYLTIEEQTDHLRSILSEAAFGTLIWEVERD